MGLPTHVLGPRVRRPVPLPYRFISPGAFLHFCRRGALIPRGKRSEADNTQGPAVAKAMADREGTPPEIPEYG